MTLVPSYEEGKILAILDTDDVKLPCGKPGQIVKVKHLRRLDLYLIGFLIKLQIAGIPGDRITERGIICEKENWPFVCEQFEANIIVLDLLAHKPILSGGYTCMIQFHSYMEEAMITHIIGKKRGIQ